MKYEINIRSFIKYARKKGFLNEDAKELTLFIVLAEAIEDIVHENVTWEGEVEDDYVVQDVYNDIIVPIIRPLLKSNEDIMKALELQMKYGTVITVTTEERDKLIQELKNKK